MIRHLLANFGRRRQIQLRRKQFGIASLHPSSAHSSQSMLTDMINAPARSLWIFHGLPPDALDDLHLSENPDPAVNSQSKLGTAAQTAVGVSGLAAAHFHHLRTGDEQQVSVDARHAVLEFNSEKYYTVDGKLPPGQLFDELSDMYRTKDGYVRLHANFPHHKQGLLDLLNCPPDKSAVATALLEWNMEDFERETQRRGLCAGMLRSYEMADLHPQGIRMANANPVELVKIGDAPKREVHDAASFKHALEGIRVLDLTRVLAGPVCGKTLAAHGADVIHITSPNLPALPMLYTETSRGKRNTQLDLNIPTDKQKLYDLVKHADVFLQGYRPGGLRDRGFGPENLAAIRPGLVYASVSAFWYEGPFKDLKSFDSLVQTMAGMNVAEAEAYKEYIASIGGDTSSLPPYRALPMQGLDHAAGFLLAYGIVAALCKTITEGGSWKVHISLGATLLWMRRLGSLGASAFGEGKPLPPRSIPLDPEVAALSTTIERDTGDEVNCQLATGHTMTAMRHAAVLSKTPVKEGKAPMRLDTHWAEWLPR